MNKESLKDVIQKINDSDQKNLKVFVMLKSGKIKNLKISTDVSDSLLKLFVPYLMEEFVTTDTEYKIKPVDEMNDESANTYYFFDTSNMYERLTTFQLFTDTQEVFSFDDASFNDIETFFISIASEDNKVFLYKKHYPINLLKRGKVLHLFKSNEHIDEFKEDILRLDRSFQFLSYNGNILVANLNMLERQLGYSDIIIKNAKDVLQIISSLDFLADMAKLEEMVLTTRIAKKVNRVKSSRVIDVIKADIKRVQGFIDKIAELKSSLKFNDDNKLEVTTKVAVEKLLKLLDDAYLKSELTEEWYNSLNKDSIDAPSTDN